MAFRKYIPTPTPSRVTGKSKRESGEGSKGKHDFQRGFSLVHGSERGGGGIEM